MTFLNTLIHDLLRVLRHYACFAKCHSNLTFYKYAFLIGLSYLYFFNNFPKWLSHMLPTWMCHMAFLYSFLRNFLLWFSWMISSWLYCILCYITYSFPIWRSHTVFLFGFPTLWLLYMAVLHGFLISLVCKATYWAVCCSHMLSLIMFTCNSDRVPRKVILKRHIDQKCECVQEKRPPGRSNEFHEKFLGRK